jgi:hypothetical protein
MVGMLTGDRVVRLEITGMCRQPSFHTSNYVVTVPYGSMSRTMQNIMRLGGKVTGVHMSDVAAASGVAVTPPEKAVVSPSGKGKKK